MSDGLTDLERELLAACKAQHAAIDMLFAMLMARDSTFRPSQTGAPWDAVVQGHSAIKLAESVVAGHANPTA